MGLGPEEKYLEQSGYVTPNRRPPSLAIPGALKIASRLIPPLSIALLLALLIGALAFFIHARDADDQADADRRVALRDGIEQLELTAKGNAVSAEALRALEAMSGVRDLKWETEPNDRGRNIQSLQDANGRILGWLSWESERPVTATALRFAPLLLLIALGLLSLAGLSMWYVRKIGRELEAANIRTWRAARQDPITGLPDATAILEVLEHMMAHRHEDEFVTVCYLDLSGYRELSDVFGRPWSNELVRVAAERLRELDWSGHALGRLGRHRFILMLRSADPGAGMRMAEDAYRLVAKPMNVQDQIVQVRPKIGMTQAPRDGLTSDELFRHATLAMRTAKRAEDPIIPFDPLMETDFRERRFLERELSRALDEDSLELHYQPIVSAEGSRIVGVEALLRWTHPTRGNIPPMVFVPVAEQTGMMGRLGEYVLYRALNDAKRWPNLYIAVNLSPIQVKDRALFTLVSAMLEETGTEPSRLVLEITEGVLMNDPEESRKRLEEIRGLGVRVALDDFGSGYSSLSYLQHFPCDKLKIDSTFVSTLGKSENSGFIIQAIVALGKALNLSVLVEGVETEQQRVLLRLAGCDEMQGFLFARPAPRQTIDALLLQEKLEAVRSAQGAQGAAQVS